MKDRIVTALDVSSREDALALVRELGSLTGMFKVGSQLFVAQGPSIVRDIVRAGSKVFLDLKFHDIPNTVTRAAVEAATLGVSMMTVHASGGRAMMESVLNELNRQFGNARPWIVGVTVLTSLEDAALHEVGVDTSVDHQVGRLAVLAQTCGLDGVVCSPRELSTLRARMPRDFKLVIPGIRMPDQSMNDQQRIATPRDAIRAGADYVVVGRAVTTESNPRAAMTELLATLDARGEFR
jgi:orotidine-5'-phosphate decarboxylase